MCKPESKLGKDGGAEGKDSGIFWFMIPSADQKPHFNSYKLGAVRFLSDSGK